MPALQCARRHPTHCGARGGGGKAAGTQVKTLWSWEGGGAATRSIDGHVDSVHVDSVHADSVHVDSVHSSGLHANWPGQGVTQVVCRWGRGRQASESGAGEVGRVGPGRWARWGG